MAMSKSEHGHTAEAAKTPEHQENPNGKRILIVEDDRLSMTLLSDFLSAHGYSVLKTSEGLEAIGLARDEQPDLILMDIRLPEISGFEVALAAVQYRSAHDAERWWDRETRRRCGCRQAGLAATA